MSKRLFIAVRLPAELQHALGAAAGELRRAYHGQRISWVEQHLYHQTLHYLGDIDESAVDGVSHTVARIASSLPAPRCTVTGTTGIFTVEGGQQVLWATMTEGGDSLVQAHAKLAAALPLLGIMPPKRDLHLHITIARIREPLAAPFPALNLADTTFTPPTLDVIESVLQRGGPLYTVIASHPFHAA